MQLLSESDVVTVRDFRETSVTYKRPFPCFIPDRDIQMTRILPGISIHAEGKPEGQHVEVSLLQFTLNVHPGAAYIIGNTTGDWTDGYAASALTAPADGSGEWVSPAFTSAGELRAYVKVPGIEWYHTEFTLYKGAIFWRNLNIISNWAENAGADYSVACEPGQKLYVNFDQNTAEVK
jgi:hypothetical protein